jgi:hypothetical protein
MAPLSFPLAPLLSPQRGEKRGEEVGELEYLHISVTDNKDIRHWVSHILGTFHDPRYFDQI